MTRVKKKGLARVDSCWCGKSRPGLTEVFSKAQEGLRMTLRSRHGDSDAAQEELEVFLDAAHM